MASRITRQRILDAAQQLIEREGSTGLTTRAIAQVAGVAEGTLFKHFARKEDLCLAVVLENSPRFIDTVAHLRPGTRSVRKNLEAATRAALPFCDKLIPLAAALFADTKLLMRHRAALEGAARGPRDAFDVIAAYIAAEQRLGRVHRQAMPLMVSAMLLGACFHRAFLRHGMGRHLLPMSDAQFARALAATMTSGLGGGARTR